MVHIDVSLNMDEGRLTGMFQSVKTSIISSYRAAQIDLLHALAAIAAENNLGQGIMVKIKFNIIASLYDYNPNLAAFMKVRALLSLWPYRC